MNKSIIHTLMIVSIGLVGIVAIIASMIYWLDLETTGNSTMNFLFFLYPIQLLVDFSLLIGFFIIVVALLRIKRVPLSAIKLFHFSIVFFVAPLIFCLFLVNSSHLSMIIAGLLTVLCPLIAAKLIKGVDFQKKTTRIMIIFVIMLIIGIGTFFAWKHLGQIGKISSQPSAETEQPSDEISDWRVYKNQEYGLEFEYPGEWGEITFESQKTGELFIFNSPEEKIGGIWYHQLSGMMAFIEYGRKFYLLSIGEERYQEMLKVIDQDKMRKLVYTGDAPEQGEDWGVRWRGNISEINFSPDGKYIALRDSGYDWSELKILEIQSGKMILDDYNVWCCGWLRDNIHWSSDSKILVIESEIDWAGGRGAPEALFVSDYNHPEILNKVFDVDWRKSSDGYEVDNIYFINDVSLFFSVVQRDESSGTGEIIGVEAKYQYNAQTKELKEL